MAEPATEQALFGKGLLTPPKRATAGLLRLLVSVVAVLLSASPAAAHKLNVWADVEGTTIRGEAYFRGGVPAQGAKVQALAPDGQTLGQATTDSEGKFTLVATRRCDWRLVIDAGEGHGGQYIVKAADLPDDLPGLDGAAKPDGETSDPSAEAPVSIPESSEGATVAPSRLEEIVEAAVHKEIASLKRQLQEHEQRVRWSDVLGGIGYIVGLTGLLFYFFGAGKKRAE